MLVKYILIKPLMIYLYFVLHVFHFGNIETKDHRNQFQKYFNYQRTLGRPLGKRRIYFQ